MGVVSMNIFNCLGQFFVNNQTLLQTSKSLAWIIFYFTLPCTRSKDYYQCVFVNKSSLSQLNQTYSICGLFIPFSNHINYNVCQNKSFTVQNQRELWDIVTGNLDDLVIEKSLASEGHINFVFMSEYNFICQINKYFVHVSPLHHVLLLVLSLENQKCVTLNRIILFQHLSSLS